MDKITPDLPEGYSEYRTISWRLNQDNTVFIQISDIAENKVGVIPVAAIALPTKMARRFCNMLLIELDGKPGSGPALPTAPRISKHEQQGEAPARNTEKT